MTAHLRRLIVAVRDGDAAMVEDAVLRLSTSRRVFAAKHCASRSCATSMRSRYGWASRAG